MRKFFAFLVTFLVFSSAVFAKDMRFVQVSDVRFNSESENNVLHKMVDDINKQRDVEFVIFTGDNISRTSKEDLTAFLNEAKRLNSPFYIVIGDKDVNKHKELSKAQYIKTIKKHVRKYKPSTPSYEFEYDGVVFLVADGAKDVIPGTNGYFKDDVLTWLDVQLDLYKKQNVIIFQHFPLIPPAEKETYYTFKPENYLKILAKHNNVKAVISGHFGVNSEQTVNGIVHITTAGAPFYRIIDVMDCDSSTPTIWAELKEVR